MYEIKRVFYIFSCFVINLRKKTDRTEYLESKGNLKKKVKLSD